MLAGKLNFFGRRIIMDYVQSCRSVCGAMEFLNSFRFELNIWGNVYYSLCRSFYCVASRVLDFSKEMQIQHFLQWKLISMIYLSLTNIWVILLMRLDLSRLILYLPSTLWFKNFQISIKMLIFIWPLIRRSKWACTANASFLAPNT